MVIGILLITLTIINVFLLILGIVLIFTYFYYYSIAIFFVNIMLYLVISIIFFKHTNKQLEKEKHILKSFNLTKCIDRENGVNVIEFNFNNNKWISKKDKNLEFILENYFFVFEFCCISKSCQNVQDKATKPHHRAKFDGHLDFHEEVQGHSLKNLQKKYSKDTLMSYSS